MFKTCKSKLLISVLLIGILLCGVFNVYAQEKYVFYFPSHIGAGDPNLRVWTIAIEDFESRYPEVEVKYFATAEFDIRQFKEYVETAIAANPDGIILPIVQPEAIEEPLQRAIEQGIPVMAINIDDPRPQPDKIDYLGYIGESGYKTGWDLGERVLKEFAPNKPKHVVSEVALLGHVCIEARAQGFVDVMEENGVKATRLATGDKESEAKALLTSFIMANPDVDVVLSTATYATPWTWSVLENLKKTNDITMVTVDASPTSLEAVIDGKALATHSQNMYMQVYLGLEMLYFYNAYGMDPPKEILTGPIIIDKANVEKWKNSVQKLWGEEVYKNNILW